MISRSLNLRSTALFAAALLAGSAQASPLSNYSSHLLESQQLLVQDDNGSRLSMRPYGDYMVRLQFAEPNEDFLPDDHYEMIASHAFEGSLSVVETEKKLIATSGSIRVEISKFPLRTKFFDATTGDLLLADSQGAILEDSEMSVHFQYDPNERFLGFGQKPLGYMDRIALDGKKTRRNYAEYGIPGRGAQGNLLVPFYLSDKGYGIFANTTFPNEFSFGAAGEYSLAFETEGFPAQMDYLFILGPDPVQIIDRYTQLTGRPRLPPKWAFGLQLSDNDPRINNEKIGPSWWKEMTERHRAAGLPLDHMVFDNDWRAGSGGWSGSWFEFNKELYPSPESFREWYESLGLSLTLDLNMNNANDSWGWKEEYNIPTQADCPDSNADSYPDYTNPEVRAWNWELFWKKALDPELDYPGEGIWMDESDGVWTPSCVSNETILHNGRPWLEMKNYYYFLIGKAIAAEGWDNSENGAVPGIGPERRPYVWVRGGTAGSQRFATHWTGDIHFSDQSMQGQILAMQVSGISGFPYFNHDAGGFAEHDRAPGPNDDVYIQWGMALGSFSPIWRPHGYGEPRWPTNRSQKSLEAALLYGRLRYELMPYIYTAAHQATETGLPMARAMSLMHPKIDHAWDFELQYYWGDSMLVAPGLNLEGKELVQSVWLPPASGWYDFWTGELLEGQQIIEHRAEFGKIPVFVKSGAIIPRREYAQSVSELSDKKLVLDVYAGDSGSYTLVEDDGLSEFYRTRGEIRRTAIDYEERGKAKALTIHHARGDYQGATRKREYTLRFHGIDAVNTVQLDGDALPSGSWSLQDSVLELSIPARSVHKPVVLTISL